jgi:NADH:ubiquinone reductase (H+-translocating)
MDSIKKVVVVGGGFAGINFVKALAKDKRFNVTLVDKNNYHFFPPLLYQVATAFIELSNISYPFRRMFQGKKNLRFHMGALKKVNPSDNMIETETGNLSYDYLVLALGTETNYFGMESVQQCSLPMKTIDEALDLRNSLLLNMERAVRTGNEAEREKLLNIVIAGGGPTGVELAGMLAEMSRNIARLEYPEIKHVAIKVHIVDAGPALLGPMSKKSQDEATRVLRRLGVNVINNTSVKAYEKGKVVLSDDRFIETNVLIWASGVIAKEVDGLPDHVIGKGRRILVDEFNAVNGYQNIFAIGDLCFQTTDAKYPNGHPQVAQVAIQQGKNLAKNLRRIQKNETLAPFTYHDKGSMAIIAKYKAVADLPKFSFKGFFAWCVWLFIHIIPLVGFRNKIKLAFNWMISFVSNNPTLRLIVRPGKKS